MDEEVRKCGSCHKWLLVEKLGERGDGKEYHTCVCCREYWKALRLSRGMKPREKGQVSYHQHDAPLERLSRAICLTCTLPAEVCRGQLNAGCVMQNELQAKEGLGDGKDIKLRIPEMESACSESEVLAALPAGFETAGVARQRGSDRAGETWLVLR